MKSLRTLCVVTLLGAAGAAGSLAALAQGYPAKPVRFIVPLAPGDGAGAMARLIAPVLRERWGQQIVVEKRGGAGGTIGAAVGAKAAPDGYTLVMGSTNMAAAPSLMGKLPFDPLKDFAAVTLLAKTPSILAVHPSLPARSVKELIALAKARPGQINYAGGAGTTLHLNAELFKTMAKVDIVQVPYNGTGPSVIATLSGETSVIVAPAISLLPQMEAGRLRGLGITSSQRSEMFPALPTIAETVPGYDVAQWYGILVPAGTPEPIIARLNAEAVKVVQAPDFVSRMKKEASFAVGSSPQEFSAYFRDDIATWKKAIKFSGARAE